MNYPACSISASRAKRLGLEAGKKYGNPGFALIEMGRGRAV